MRFVTDGSERIRIDSSGNVGIGTNSPSVKLDVLSGTVNSDVAEFSGGNLGRGLKISTFLALNNDAGVRYDAQTAGGTHAWDTNGTERARITAAGEFLVGKTAFSDTTVGTYLTGAGSAGATSAVSDNSASTWNTYTTAGGGAYRFYVGFGGTVFATNTTISAISDQRYKENIRDLDVGLDEIMALKPRNFDWKEGKGADKKDARGFIAQEFEQVFPDLVDEWRDPAPEGEEPYKSVRQDLIPVLVKAIQEQQAMIEDLKAKVAALEGAN
jgi:hypothetical protein